MTEQGHDDPFPRPDPNGRCRFGQETFAGVRGNGRDAPIAALPVIPRLLAAGRELVGVTSTAMGPLTAKLAVTFDLNDRSDWTGQR